jgi:hypothetical protein
MTTETQANLLVQHLQAWAHGFEEAAELQRQAVRDGDPAGVGIARLIGRAEAYEDASNALQDHVGRVRGGTPPFRLRVVS